VISQKVVSSQVYSEMESKRNEHNTGDVDSLGCAQVFRMTVCRDCGLSAKILQIMRNNFKDYARTFANYAHLFRFCIAHNEKYLLNQLK